MDPLEFRFKGLKDERLRAVFEAASRKFGWGRSKTQAGQGFGIAGGFEKGGYVATCAEVLVDRARGEVRVVRVVTAARAPDACPFRTSRVRSAASRRGGITRARLQKR